MGGLPSAMPWPALTPAEDRQHRQRLDQALRAASRAVDAGALVRGYETAANLALADEQEPAVGFFLTQAYVWALVAGDEAADSIAARLRNLGRLEPEDGSRGDSV